jgi:radical SAM protein with 4Fe4S-binding SPASM domain
MKCNLDELPELVKIGSEIGLRHIAVSDVIITYDPKVDESFQREQHLSNMPEREAKPKIHKIRDAARNLGVTLYMADYPARAGDEKSLRKQNIRICASLWETTYITVDGFVTPCCYASDPNILNMGNVFTTDFPSLWNNRRYRAIRRKLLHGVMPLAICADCPARIVSL